MGRKARGSSYEMTIIMEMYDSGLSQVDIAK